MNKTVTAQQLRTRLGEYLDRADLAGEVITIARDGRTKAVLLSYAQYRELFDRAPLSDAIQPTSLSGVSIVPSHRDLKTCDRRLGDDPESQFLLAEVLKPQRTKFDYALIDCGPRLDLSTRMALVACDEYLI